MSYGDNPLHGRLSITALNTPIEIIEPVDEPIEVTLIMAPGGGVEVYHRLASDTDYTNNQLSSAGADSIVFQAQVDGSGITLDKGDSLAVAVTSAKTVSVYAAISVVPEEEI